MLATTLVFNLRRLAHNGRYVGFGAALPIGFYLLYATMYGSGLHVAGTTWGAYFLISMAGFAAIGTTLNAAGTLTAQDRDRGWTTYLRTTPVGATRYVLGQTITAMAASLLVIVLVTLAGILVEHVAVSAALLTAVGLVWAGSGAFAAIGLTLGLWLDTASITYGVLVIYLGTSLLGGLWMPLTILPSAMRELARFLPSYHMADMGWQTLAQRAVPWQDVAVLVLYAAVFVVLGRLIYARRG